MQNQHLAFLFWYVFLAGMAMGALCVILNSLLLFIAFVLASACIALLLDVRKHRSQPAIQRASLSQRQQRRRRLQGRR